MSLETWPPLIEQLYGVVLVIVLLIEAPTSRGEGSNFQCLKQVHDSIQDPNKNLTPTWDFSNKTEGSICNFLGVECWHPEQSKVLNIRLEDMGLEGRFPQGLHLCSDLTGLYLSGNNLTGPLPSNIPQLIPYVTVLVLSNNKFSGQIPSSLGNCSYLNKLLLDDNQFSGQIPPELRDLGRLNDFSVAGNYLSGQVPIFPNTSIMADYANNPGLCGGSTLKPCKDTTKKKKSTTIVIAVSVAGSFGLVIILTGIGLYYISHVMVVKRKKTDDPEGNRWAKRMTGTKAVKVSMFENNVTKMSLSDLMKATDDFSSNNIISRGSSGVAYKATLPDGTFLMVKRLLNSQRTEKEFLSEMNTLGSVKHNNLLPLLGFCVAENERFLIYEYMANGSLFDQLHQLEPDAVEMDWPLRLKIAIRAAKGLSWLHHNCNPRIIHRNISSKCILLNEDFEPKLSDFGLARLMNPVDTHLSTFVAGGFGELGYVAPEYARTLRATPKGDIYSFGVVLLELITGERPTHVDKKSESFKGSLVEWVTYLSNSSQTHSAINPGLIGQGNGHELNQFLKVACNCVSETPNDRPTMFEVYQFLRSIGQEYGFTVDDDIVFPSNESENVDFHDELIVAQETSNIR